MRHVADRRPPMPRQCPPHHWNCVRLTESSPRRTRYPSLGCPRRARRREAFLTGASRSHPVSISLLKFFWVAV